MTRQIKYSFIMLLFSMAMVGHAQNGRPFVGYDKVPWGSSFEEVRRQYQNLRYESKDYWPKEDYGQESFGVLAWDIDRNSMIESRNFEFYQNKLWCVTVGYRNGKINNEISQTIMKMLSENYGAFSTDTVGGRMPNGTLLYSYSKKYSNELTISICYETQGSNIINYLIVYKNEKISEEMENYRKQSLRNRVQF